MRLQSFALLACQRVQEVRLWCYKADRDLASLRLHIRSQPSELRPPGSQLSSLTEEQSSRSLLLPAARRVLPAVRLLLTQLSQRLRRETATLVSRAPPQMELNHQRILQALE